MAEKPTARDVKAHLDEAEHRSTLAMAGIWGAIRGSAPADRWDHAKTDLEAAAASLAAALEALAAMEKPEAYCTICGQPILSLMAGWSHFADGGRAASTGHKPALDWREIGTPGKRTPLCTNCRVEPAMDDDGLCFECAEGDDEYE